jgi:membrane-associated phospholipid phosphatase
LDYLFQYVTVLGDGLIYIPIVLYCLLFNRKFLVPVLAGIIICTVLTHLLKRVIFPDELRPFSLEAQNIIIHRIEGVPMRRMHSFPSGHTSTAFSMALLLASVMNKKIWAFILPLIAFFVGYSGATFCYRCMCGNGYRYSVGLFVVIDLRCLAKKIW